MKFAASPSVLWEGHPGASLGTGVPSRLTLLSCPATSSPAALSHSCVRVQMSMASLLAWRAAQAREESLCPHESSFELIICLPGQSVSLRTRKIILLSAPRAGEFRAWQGRGRERWVPPGGRTRPWGTRGLGTGPGSPHTLGMAVGMAVPWFPTGDPAAEASALGGAAQGDLGLGGLCLVLPGCWASERLRNALGGVPKVVVAVLRAAGTGWLPSSLLEYRRNGERESLAGQLSEGFSGALTGCGEGAARGGRS